MEIVAIAGLLVVVAVLSVILRHQRPEQALILVLITGVVITVALLGKAESILDELSAVLSRSGLSSEYTTILFKGLGICLITQLASDTCKDAGESALSAKAELAGRVSLLLLGLPLFQKIASVAVELIGGG